MKNILLFFIMTLPLCTIGQTKQMNANLKRTITVDDVVIRQYYFPISGSITKGKSEKKQDYLDEVIQEAVTLKSDSFTVTKDKSLVYSGSITLSDENVLTIKDEKNQRVVRKLINQEWKISVNRAIEIVLGKYQKKGSKIDGDYFYFNHHRYKIMQIDDMKNIIMSHITL
jgi:predicted small secreted protein